VSSLVLIGFLAQAKRQKPKAKELSQKIGLMQFSGRRPTFELCTFGFWLFACAEKIIRQNENTL